MRVLSSVASYVLCSITSLPGIRSRPVGSYLSPFLIIIGAKPLMATIRHADLLFARSPDPNLTTASALSLPLIVDGGSARSELVGRSEV